MAEKNREQLQKELEEALAAKEVAEKEAKQALAAKEVAEEEAKQAIAAKKAAEKEASVSKQQTEELLKAAQEAEKAAEKEAEGFFKSGNDAKGKDAELVEITIPPLRGKKASKDIVITVNGMDWQIERGKAVKIPRYVYEVYRISEKQMREADAFIEEVAG